MSYADGMAAINLEMPRRIPRTEYSLEMHWDLIKKVTGIQVDAHSSDEVKTQAGKAIRKAWNYDLIWNVHTHSQVLGNVRTYMGHADYQAEGTDFNSERYSYFSEPEEVLSFDPWEKLGPIDIKQQTKIYEDHYKLACQNDPDCVNMTGIYITMISGLLELFGWDLMLMAAGMDIKGFGETANRYATWIQQYFDALGAADVPVVMIHDDMVWTSGAIFHPAWYHEYVFPNFKKYFAPILESGKKLLFTSDGTYTEFIDDIADCGVHGFVLEPTVDMKYMAEKYGKTHVIIGNVDTRILLFGSKADIRAEVKRCIDIGRDCPGYFMCVGNHIPANTPVESAIYYNECYEEMSIR